MSSGQAAAGGSEIVPAGCGANVEITTKSKELGGDVLASRANAQLEKQNPNLTHGTLTCPDVSTASAPRRGA